MHASFIPRPRLDVLTIGRCGVDIYPLQIGCGLEDVDTFGKFLGGSPTNVAVAAAKLGHTAAVITAVGDDPFGRYVRRQMLALGVYDTYVAVSARLATPVTFCEIFPPDNFPLYFYREPKAPDLEIGPDAIPDAAVADAAIFWLSATGLSAEPSYAAHLHALQVRQEGWTVLDLDYRRQLWESEDVARERLNRALEGVNVAVGNVEECAIAVGEKDPDRAADALLERGVQIAIVKQGPNGTLAKTRTQRIAVPVTPVETVNGLGAGDAFGGALCHGLLSRWSLEQVVATASTAGAIASSRLECSTAMPSEPEILATMRAHPEAAPIVGDKESTQ